MPSVAADYFRRDQDKGVTAPDLSKDCTCAEHIVHARGKRTQLTSVSLDPGSIHDFGPILYQALRERIDEDRHKLVEHGELMDHLRDSARSNDKAERIRAIHALRYARRRSEGLVTWNFSIGSVERKDLIGWAFANIQKYFRKA
ncbi:MAG: hypothetical protein NTX50_10665 [Candidatus Sumerlaeota bacterium]|nr:hypothetical protein [Candidatus Sumerlaeota bacterium]